jgi:release factor glutamine methyltransferase
LLAFPERTLDVAAAERFMALVARRATGEPLAYLTGEREFFSLPLAVSPDVLIPRAETELLVDLTLRAIGRRARATVLDVGTGSGAIAIAVKRARPDAQVAASDVSAAALAVARANAERLGVAIQWVESTWFAALGDARFDVIVSNPPYVRSADVCGPLELEPRLALDGGADGLDAYRALLAAAAARLEQPDGVLLLEHGHEQRTELTALAVANGWRVTAAHDDLAGRPRVLELGQGGAP